MGITKIALIVAGTAFLGASAVSAAPVRPSAVRLKPAQYTTIANARGVVATQNASELHGGSWALAIAAVVAVAVGVVAATDNGNGKSPGA